MCSPSPPPAPDYAGAATAQGAANKDAAIASSQLSNPNVTNAYGTQRVTYTNDPTTGNPVPNVTQSYAPGQQQIFDNNQTMQQKLGLLGIGATNYAGDILNKPLDFNGTLGTQSQGSQNVIDAYMSRYKTDEAKQQDQNAADNVARGIPVGSKAWQSQQDVVKRGENDALAQATTSADNIARTNRQQAITEMLAQRQTPLNEISALRSGSQITPLSFSGVTPVNQAAAPVFAATQAQGQAGQNAYNAQQSGSNAAMGGLFSLGAAGLANYGELALAFSDRRLKSNIVRIGDHPLGIGLYEYDIFGRRQIGVMADEVLSVRPEAVSTHESGYHMVDYGRLQ